PVTEPARSPGPDVRSRRQLSGGLVYDRACAQHDSPSSELVAAFDGERVVVSDGGDEIARIRGRPPVRWSGSGGLLAVGRRGALWTWDGQRYEGPDVPLELSRGGRASWAWSPYADCALVLDGDRLDAFHTGAGANSTTLVNENVEAAAWGPRGRVAVVLEEEGRRSLWVADPMRSTMRLVSDFDPATCCVVLGGWTRSGEALFWAGPGRSAMQDGWPLRSATPRGRTKTWGRTLPRPDTIAICDAGIVALTGSDRHLRTSRVSLLRAGKRTEHLTKRARHQGLACSADGASVVVAAGAGLTIVPFDGSPATPLTRPRRATDVDPQWGPGGVLFVRQTGPVRELWLVTPERRPRFVATLVAPPKASPELAYDWTATRPTGLLAGSGRASPTE
ncbi:MAG: hypothetical protein M3217_10885, partial [Actinomycetota bacterium]|nr:hypothetical protein [Actinomycetota bacterium]